jgi:C-terminal processing protease CtpA/Prc
LDVPIYILTNESTFSAEEEFAYDLQQINKHTLRDDRFTIIGEKTKGGAHAMTGFPLRNPESGAINEEYFLWVPTKTTINPYTHINWEDGPKKNGVAPGVKPNIEILKEEDALEIAVKHLSLLISQQPKVVDPEITQQYKDKVKEVKQSNLDSSVTIEVENKDTISPLQTTPKPWEK